ncbi:MAG: type IV secretion protein DotI [Gammaproteobacteria bacterium]|nr:MAG: type IV secretion protein DotI [Gammaproteobacteria bacterium]
MAEELQVVEIREDFYRDSFGKVILILLSVCVAIALLAALSGYLYLTKPSPVTFVVDNEWRVKSPVPIDQPYLSTPDLLQWTSDALRKAFVYDFYEYNTQLKTASQYFTADGWKVFLDQLNSYASYNDVQAKKLFVTATPASAPFILQQGLLSGRYAWWVQMPININYYAANNQFSARTLTLQVLVVRVATTNNLNGVGIDNVIVANPTTAGTGQTT